MKGPRLRAYLGLALVAAPLVAIAVAFAPGEHTTWFIVVYAVAGAGFALLATAAKSLPLRGALVAAVVLRVIFLPGVPGLSDDYQRFLWDGRVQMAGINPYLHAPRDAALDGVPFAGRAAINHPGLRTVYPPLAEATFFGVAALSDGVLALKLLFGAFDLAAAGAVWWLAGKRSRARATVLYLLCPAVILQTWESAHPEAVAVFFVVLAAGLLVHRRDALAGIALGLAVAFKITPLVLLVPALLGGRAKPARFLAGFVPTLAIPYIPYALTGGSFGSLWESGTTWTGGALVFSLLTRVSPPGVALAACVALTLAGSVMLARRLGGRPRTASAFAWTACLLVVCLPVVHSWYWLTPLALGLAAGAWLPVAIGVAAPLTMLPLGRPPQIPPWRQFGAAVGAVWQVSRPHGGREGAELLGIESVTHTGSQTHEGREPV